jgi:hypothetical protein
VIAIISGVFVGLLFSIVYALIARLVDHAPLPLHVLPVLFSAACFGACRIVLAPSWNRRATLLMGRRGG